MFERLSEFFFYARKTPIPITLPLRLSRTLCRLQRNSPPHRLLLLQLRIKAICRAQALELRTAYLSSRLSAHLLVAFA